VTFENVSLPSAPVRASTLYLSRGGEQGCESSENRNASHIVNVSLTIRADKKHVREERDMVCFSLTNEVLTGSPA
jgi:hypothetical protein